MKKIMFNDRYGLTAAVLQGRKTMTRRICKEYATGQLILTRDVESIRFYPKENIVEFLMKDGTIKVSVPPYKDNEVVAVAQSYKDTGLFDIYRGPEDTKGWSNKMFVRADLMPHQIQITDINIERLQDITDEDCIKEGIEEDAPYYWVPINYELPNWKELNEKVSDMYANNDGKIYPHFWDSPKKAFSALIDAVSGKGTWERNPFVFAYSFKLIK